MSTKPNQTAIVKLPKNLMVTNTTLRESNVGAICAETMHYDHSSELTHKVAVYDNRVDKTGYGKCIFEGTIIDLIKLILNEPN